MKNRFYEKVKNKGKVRIHKRKILENSKD